MSVFTMFQENTCTSLGSSCFTFSNNSSGGIGCWFCSRNSLTVSGKLDSGVDVVMGFSLGYSHTIPWFGVE